MKVKEADSGNCPYPYDDDKIFPIDKNLIIKFTNEEARLASGLYTPDQALILKQAATFLLFKAFNLLKSKEDKKCVIIVYNAAIDILKGASLEIDEEWARIEEIVRSLQDEEDVMSYMRTNVQEFQKRFDFLNQSLINHYSMAHEDRIGIKITLLDEIKKSSIETKAGGRRSRGIILIISTALAIMVTISVSTIILSRYAVPFASRFQGSEELQPQGK